MTNIKTYRAKIRYFDYGGNLVTWEKLEFSVSDIFPENALKKLVAEALKDTPKPNSEIYSYRVELEGITK